MEDRRVICMTDEYLNFTKGKGYEVINCGDKICTVVDDFSKRKRIPTPDVFDETKFLFTIIVHNHD